MWIKKTCSAWKFMSSDGLGVSWGASLQAGIFEVRDPNGQVFSFKWVAAGGGPSEGIKLPKLKILGKAISMSSDAITVPVPLNSEVGVLRVLVGARNDDLSYDDFRGTCLFLECGGSLVSGVSVRRSIFVIKAGNMPGLSVANIVSNPQLLMTATAILDTLDFSIWLQENIGATVSLGRVL
jgi:hypothetical protein